MNVGVLVKMGVVVGVLDGLGINVNDGDGETVSVAVGKTSTGSARTAPVKRRDMITTAMVSPIKTYLTSEDMEASIRRQARGVKERRGMSEATGLMICDYELDSLPDLIEYECRQLDQRILKIGCALPR